MIDVRRLRTDPGGVGPPWPAGTRPSCWRELDAAVELDREQRDLAGRRDDLRRRINELSK